MPLAHDLAMKFKALADANPVMGFAMYGTLLLMPVFILACLLGAFEEE